MDEWCRDNEVIFMKSIQFPEMFTRTVTNTVSDYDATLQNLKMLLWSEKGELFGDPYFGTGLKRYFYDQNDVVLIDILIDDIYTAITLFMPQIKVNRNDIQLFRSGKGQVTAKIKALNQADFSTDMYNIVLLEAEV